MEEVADSCPSWSHGVNGNEGQADDFRGLVEGSVVGGTKHLRLKDNLRPSRNCGSTSHWMAKSGRPSKA